MAITPAPVCSELGRALGGQMPPAPTRTSVAVEVAATNSLLLFAGAFQSVLSAPAASLAPLIFVRVGTTQSEYVRSLPKRVGLSVLGPVLCVLQGAGMFLAVVPAAA